MGTGTCANSFRSLGLHKRESWALSARPWTAWTLDQDADYWPYWKCDSSRINEWVSLQLVTPHKNRWFPDAQSNDMAAHVTHRVKLPMRQAMMHHESWQIFSHPYGVIPITKKWLCTAQCPIDEIQTSLSPCFLWTRQELPPPRWWHSVQLLTLYVGVSIIQGDQGTRRAGQWTMQSLHKLTVVRHLCFWNSSSLEVLFLYERPLGL